MRVASHESPLDELVVPDGTEAQERDLVTDGDVLLGNRAAVEFGVRGRNVVAGEGAAFGGKIEAEGDCRLDMWTDVAGTVLVGGDAYLGERVHVGGELLVAGNLDIGDEVDVDEGFEANGWVVVRNPLPTLVVLFVFLKHLLAVGEEVETRQVVAELHDGTADQVAEPLVVPSNATVSDDAWCVSTPARIGDGCRLHGNVRATSIEVGRDNELYGSLRAHGDIYVDSGTTVHGDVTTRDGTITLAEGVRVLGDVSCGELELGTDAVVDGVMRAAGPVSMQTGAD